MPETHEQRVDRLFNSLKRKSKRQNREAKGKTQKAQKKKLKGISGTVQKIKNRHKVLGDM